MCGHVERIYIEFSPFDTLGGLAPARPITHDKTVPGNLTVIFLSPLFHVL